MVTVPLRGFRFQANLRRIGNRFQYFLVAGMASIALRPVLSCSRWLAVPPAEKAASGWVLQGRSVWRGGRARTGTRATMGATNSPQASAGKGRPAWMLVQSQLQTTLDDYLKQASSPPVILGLTFVLLRPGRQGSLAVAVADGEGAAADSETPARCEGESA
eukprot:1394897-Rhodomonas_salina.1